MSAAKDNHIKRSNTESHGNLTDGFFPSISLVTVIPMENIPSWYALKTTTRIRTKPLILLWHEGMLTTQINTKYLQRNKISNLKLEIIPKKR